MRLSHVEWAAAHDWYRGCAERDTESGTVWSVVVVDTTDGLMYAFTDYQELRDWAGY